MLWQQIRSLERPLCPIFLRDAYYGRPSGLSDNVYDLTRFVLTRIRVHNRRNLRNLHPAYTSRGVRIVSAVFHHFRLTKPNLEK